MDRDLTALAERASDIHCRMIRGTPTEFERARLLRDMHQLTTAIRTQAGRMRELGELILAAGDETPPGGGRAA